MLQAGAVVAVAGSAKKMPADVAEAFRVRPPYRFVRSSRRRLAALFSSGRARRMENRRAQAARGCPPLALQAVAKTEGGMGEGDAQAWMRQLEASRRYTVECWV